MKSSLLVLPLLISMSSAAAAGLSVRFDEGAPKDRFTLTNSGECNLKQARVMLDLSSSKAGLIFDVTASGAGVEVFQPLEFVKGADKLSRIPQVRDGDNRLELSIAQLKKGESIAFTIDVDDTLGGQEIIVSDSEISGANIQLSAGSNKLSGTFGANAVASIDGIECSN